MIPLTLTLKKTTAWVVKTSVTIMINSSPIRPIQDYIHPDNHAHVTSLRDIHIDLSSTFMVANMFNRLDARVC